MGKPTVNSSKVLPRKRLNIEEQFFRNTGLMSNSCVEMRRIFVRFTLGLLLGCSLSTDALAGSQPNFVFILGEGHGWSSTSVQMDDLVPALKSAFVRTPNLEKLARDGMRFANFYAASPRCTPSRVAVVTGKSPARLHMTFIGEGKRDSGDNPTGRVLTPVASLELPTSEKTIAELLKRAGYATDHFGKWHMGRISPGQYGFDESEGATSNGGSDNVDNPHPKELYGMTALLVTSKNTAAIKQSLDLI